MAGLACGAKLTAVPEVLIGVPAVAAAVLLLQARRGRAEESVVGRRAAARPRRPGALRHRGAARLRAVAGAQSALGRQPSLPGRHVRARPGYFSDIQVERWRRAHSPQPEQRPIGARLRAFGSEVVGSWQFAYVLVPLGVVAMLIVGRRPENIFLAGMLLVLTVFWLGFTHLQGRFYLLALPVCAIAVAQIDWRRLLALALLLVLAAAVPGVVRIHRTMLARVRRGWIHHRRRSASAGWAVKPNRQRQLDYHRKRGKAPRGCPPAARRRRQGLLVPDPNEPAELSDGVRRRHERRPGDRYRLGRHRRP